MRIFCTVVLASLALIGVRPASAFDHKCPAPGTELRTTLTSSGAPIRYDGEQGLWCLRSRGGQPMHSELGHFRFFARTTAHDGLYDKYVDAANALWPLAPGNTARFLYQDIETGRGANATVGNFLYEHYITVEEARQISVPAGTFTVVPIVDELRGTGGNVHRSQLIFYYAPELGTNVKFEFRAINGVGNEATPWELVSIKSPAAR
jgi:hypothetical protein